MTCPSALKSNTHLANERHRLDCKRLFPMLLKSGGAANLELSVIHDLLREVSCLVPKQMFKNSVLTNLLQLEVLFLDGGLFH